MFTFSRIRRFFPVFAVLAIGGLTANCSVTASSSRSVVLEDRTRLQAHTFTENGLLVATSAQVITRCGDMMIRGYAPADPKSPIMLGGKSTRCEVIATGGGTGPGVIPAIAPVAAAGMLGGANIIAAKIASGGPAPSFNQVVDVKASGGKAIANSSSKSYSNSGGNKIINVNNNSNQNYLQQVNYQEQLALQSQVMGTPKPHSY